LTTLERGKFKKIIIMLYVGDLLESIV